MGFRGRNYVRCWSSIVTLDCLRFFSNRIIGTRLLPPFAFVARLFAVTSPLFAMSLSDLESTVNVIIKFCGYLLTFF